MFDLSANIFKMLKVGRIYRYYLVRKTVNLKDSAVFIKFVCRIRGNYKVWYTFKINKCVDLFTVRHKIIVHLKLAFENQNLFYYEYRANGITQ